MTKQSRIFLAIAAVIGIGILFLVTDRTFHFTGGHGKAVDALIARNVAARGGAEAWRAVETLRFEGRMDLGQDVNVPYTLEQKRSGKMCLAFEFDDETATQCVNGDTGWKLLPFMGRPYAEPMSELELHEMAAAVAVDGLLFDSDQRGYDVELVGHEVIDGRNTSKLEVTLPGDVVRWVYIDEETALEVRLDAIRHLRSQQRLVATRFSDWREVDGLLIPHRQDTQMEGDENEHFVTVESVSVNQPISDERFAMPAGRSNTS
jgi:hypothetical protein